MPKRGRPPKNKPLNSADPSGRGSSSHHSSHSSANEEDDNPKNEQTDLKLYLPSVDLVPKLLENGYITKLSSMSTIEYHSDEDSNIPMTTDGAPINIDQEDLEHACKDALLFKKYIRDSKNLINKQIEKLEKYEDRFQTPPTSLESSPTPAPIKAIVQRNKYKPKVRKQTTKSNITSSRINIDNDFQDVEGNSVIDAPKSSEYESASEIQTQHSITDDNDDNDDNDEKDDEDDDNDDDDDDNNTSSATQQPQQPQNKINNSSSSNNNSSNNLNPTPNKTIGGKTASKGNGGKVNKNVNTNRPTGKVNESDEDVDIVEVDDHQPANVNRLGTGKNHRNSTMDVDMFQDTDEQPSETESVHSNKSHQTNNSKSTSKNRKGVSKNNSKKKGEDKKRKKQEEEARHHYVGPGVFWASMESYLRPIKDSDIEFITPRSEEQDAKFFEIPQLGTHYSEAWQLEDLERLQPSGSGGKHRQNIRNNRSAIDQTQDDIFGNSLPSLSFGDPKESDQLSISTDEIILGDLSMRLLSTLIDESMLISTPLNQTQQQQQQQQQQQGSGPAIRLNQQIFTSYTPNSQLTLEQRIQQELRSLNLYDDYKLPTSVNQLIPTKEKERDREDDEICEELRILQNSLRAQLAINNDLRLKALKEIKSILVKQDILKRKISSHAVSEKNYQKLMKRDKKKKKLKIIS
ncbi:hypothetical protein DICPUDRAFT_154707 [Dictyostelium purpureum]|uniref:Uncharacterized protein n=1 Tax=Dictyostelium purpureum TaxID=5786 RepID=F0ZS21_DICPU|nr:uncharacterized protein DICPUDRAFT_154707 [Dictyostelium purpureum]EGC33261.1 hypothetical protein DICPUDRAFT_154707 [Dictyostelium purpureum]|eukprot:XP_003290208.1 hypothetical protein DICPUDRAFT_154707 [Dictyostelium purpureum]